MARKIIGVMLIASPFIALAAWSAVNIGWKTLFVFGITFALVAVVGAGCYLLQGDE